MSIYRTRAKELKLEEFSLQPSAPYKSMQICQGFLYFPRLLSPCLTEEGDRSGTGLSSEQRQEMVNEETHLQQHLAAGNL